MSVTQKLSSAWARPARRLYLPLTAVVMYGSMSVANYILVRNQSNSVYPAEGDSIGIPLMGLMFQHVLSFLFVGVAMALLRSGRVVHWVGVALMATVILGYLSQALGWTDLLHYPIALGLGAVVILLVTYTYFENRGYRRRVRDSNPPLVV